MRVCKWLVILGIAMAIFPLTIQAGTKNVTPESLPGVQVIGVDEVKKWLDQGEDIFILDARKSADYETGHLPEAENCTVPSDLNVEAAAINQSINALKQYKVLKDLGKETKIITYCNGYT
jgi:rhodanese-related sulfurtransferase